MNNLKKFTPYYLHIARSIGKHTCIAVIYAVVKYLFFFFSSSHTSSEIFIMKCIIISVVYLSTSLAFAMYNKQRCLSFHQNNSKGIVSSFFTFDFLVDFAVMALFFLCFSIELVNLIVILFAILSNFLTDIYAKKIWSESPSSQNPTYLFSVKLIVHIFLSIPGLFILFLILGSIGPLLRTMLYVVRLLSYTIIIPVILTFFLYVRALDKMHRFLKKLKKFCLANKIKYPNIIKPYLSVFIPKPQNTFEIEIHGKIYEVSLLSFTNIFKPVIIKSDGFFYRISARALKRKEKPSFFFETSYTFESNRSKIIIITSVPYVVKLQEGTQTKTFDTGDTCAGYKIFTPQGFFGAAERNTISRKTFD